MADNGHHVHNGHHHWHVIGTLVRLSTMLSQTHDGMHKSGNDSSDVTHHGHSDLPLAPLLGHDMRWHLREIYHDMCNGIITKRLKRETLERFFAETQGEDLNTRPLPLGQESYEFEDFIQLWKHYYSWDATLGRRVKEERRAEDGADKSTGDKEVKVNAGVAAGTAVGEMDLTKSITNYFISSSHNTYLEGNQLSSPASVDVYRKVLRKGCRCIEIDVWNHPPSTRSRTPSKSPHPEHRRHLSQNSATSSVHDGLEAVTKAMAGIGMSRTHSRTPSAAQLTPSHTHSPSASQQLSHTHSPSASQQPSHTHSPSASQQPFPSRNPGRDSAASLGPLALSERQGRPLSRKRSRSSSGSTTLGGPANEPVVMHAHKLGEDDWTLGTPVGFREVCKAIAESAFVNSPLPVIVSLEVHAEGDQQEMMVAIMKEEWAGLLLDQPLEHVNPGPNLPSLGDLQNKILVKVKKVNMGSTLGTSLARYEPHSPVAISPTEAHAAKVKIGTSLASLAIYTQSEHLPKVEHLESLAKNPAHIFSLDEDNLAEYYEKAHQAVFNHNRKYFMRVYPDATKHVMSTNPDPARCWRKGVQMVALNWQTLDEAMMLNHAMFADQGGWVLKPKGYRSSDSSGNPALATSGLRRQLDLTITILAGQYLPHPQLVLKKGSTSRNPVSGRHYNGFRPRVKVELHVETYEHEAWSEFIGPARVDKAQLKKKTEAGRSDNPNWGIKGHTMKFKAIPHVVEELSFVRFRVEDENVKLHKDIWQFGNLAGWACIRLDRLQQGYRFLSLFDATGHPTDGKLLVKIEKRLK